MYELDFEIYYIFKMVVLVVWDFQFYRLNNICRQAFYPERAQMFKKTTLAIVGL